jgi:hypothetical protein
MGQTSSHTTYQLVLWVVEVVNTISSQSCTSGCTNT